MGKFRRLQRVFTLKMLLECEKYLLLSIRSGLMKKFEKMRMEEENSYLIK